MRAVEPDVTLALLFGVVKRMRMQERPDELAADIFEAEFEMRVLIDGVVAAEISGGADGDALLVGDFLRSDQARGVAGSRCSDCGIEGMRKVIAKGDAGGGGFDLRFERSVVRWRESRGHDCCAALY